MIRTVACLSMLALAACTGEQQTVATPSSSPTPEASASGPPPSGPYASCKPATISGDGWCGITFGMTAAMLEQNPPFPVMRLAGDNMGEPDACYLFTSIEGPGSLALMIEGQKVQRIDVGLESIRTAEGVGVGDSENKLKTTYGDKLNSGPDKYDAKVTIYAMPSGPGKLVFEVETGRVRALRAGVAPQVDYVERCG